MSVTPPTKRLVVPVAPEAGEPVVREFLASGHDAVSTLGPSAAPVSGAVAAGTLFATVSLLVLVLLLNAWIRLTLVPSRPPV